MACKVEISFSQYQANSVFFQITDCGNIKSVVCTFPTDKATFFGGRTHGIHTPGDKEYVIVEDTGYVEYISPSCEVTCMIPADIAGQFIEYIKDGRIDKPITEEKIITETENPQEAGRKRRKTRRNKSKCQRSKRGC